MYDFDTLRPRVGMGSLKWDLAAKAGCPADTVPLTVADMEFISAPVIVQAVREAAEFGMWGYCYDDEHFKTSINKWMERRHGWTPKSEWALHTSGVVHALYIAVRAYTKPGDGVVIQPPVYPPFFSAVNKTGRTLVENPLVLNEEGHYAIDFAHLEAQLANARMMIFCSPHNPVGRVWTAEEVEEVARLCKKHDVFLFSDEIHCDFAMQGHKHVSVGTLPAELRDNSAIGTSASKTFSLAGLATSTIFISDEEKRRQFEARMEKDGYDFNSLFGVVATRAAYQGAEDWLEEALEYIEENYNTLNAFVKEKLPQLRLYPMEGTYLAWLDMRGLGMEADDLMAFLQKDACLYLNDGRMFGTGGEGFTRVNLACPRGVLVGALQRLQAAVARR